MLASYIFIIFYYLCWSNYQVDTYMIPIYVKSTESYNEIWFVCNIVKKVCRWALYDILIKFQVAIIISVSEWFETAEILLESNILSSWGKSGFKNTPKYNTMAL